MRLLYLLIFLFLISSCTDKKEALFNGKNLDDWTIYVNVIDEAVNLNKYFYVNDGMIETIGKPVGYARTNKEYENYKLHVEWRYPEEPTNSGILVHVKGDDKIWVSHYQGQLKHENAGDFIIHGIESATLNGEDYTSTEDDKPLIPKMNPTNENPAGEWNTYEIICKGSTIELYVNGLLQNTATDCSVTKGGIGLQAEGSKIQFRNLWVEPIE